MLESLHISNYALIDRLEIDFYDGFNIITGETGAGKSVIMGALGLILGARADMSVLQAPDKKCTVEGSFRLDGNLKEFFRQEDLDYDEHCILRREITNQGKSRAFVNDTPVTLKTLQDLAMHLIDIHSQHQNLQLAERAFQMKVVDIIAKNNELLLDYRQQYGEWRQRLADIKRLEEEAKNAGSELDYLQFQFRQLCDARLADGELEELETEQKALEHADELKQTFGGVADALYRDESGILPAMKEQLAQLARIRELTADADEMSQRLQSCFIELKDIATESYSLAERTENNPERTRLVAERLDLLYSLLQKFKLRTVADLIALRDEVEAKIDRAVSFDEEIAALRRQADAIEQAVIARADEIGHRRREVAPRIAASVIEVLQKLGMANVEFNINFSRNEIPGLNGFDDIRFLFSSNRNAEPQEISRIASGGEISRVMLAIKTLIADGKALPAIVFDEIDTGVSGEVAVRMGLILKDMARHIQVIDITHLPQIAAKGQYHFKVFKEDDGHKARISIRPLNDAERIDELAMMLGGDRASSVARETARELLR
ncbi:MAG: DNA repair protein RecN [Bacteroidales bacterium]|jgi:DNA repair protein RecN (Recombination protein N)|nr:DNA repair protein RecN [Bacteroidales bacterium]